MQTNLDSLTISALVLELNSTFANKKIEKVFSPTRTSLSIHLLGVQNYLYISSEKGMSRICSRRDSLNNPLVPPAFCMILRKYLCGGKIIRFEQINDDRIVEILISTWQDEDTVSKRLIVELTGNDSNIILAENDYIILDSIVKSKSNSKREIVQNAVYEPFAKLDKIDPKSCLKDQFVSAIKRELLKSETNKEQSNPNSILSAPFYGIGESLAAEVLFDADVNDLSISAPDIDATLLKLFESFRRYVNANGLVLMKPSVGIKTVPLTIGVSGLDSYLNKKLIDEVVICNSISDMLNMFYGHSEQKKQNELSINELKKITRNALSKCKKKRALQVGELDSSFNREIYKRGGDLITSNLHILKTPLNMLPKTKNNKVEVEVIDYYEEDMPMIKISLNPALTPSQNAQQLFAKYNKAVRAEAAILSNIAKTDEEIKYLESVYESLERVDKENEISEIKEELISFGIMNKNVKKEKKSKKTALQPSKYVYVDSMGISFEIYVGKNNRQNELLSFKLARGNDMWLHAKDIPGSHVVVRKGQYEITKEVVEAAALLAGYFSKGRLSSKVPVDITEARNVRKPNVTAPGMAIYDKQNTIYVTPSFEALSNIFRNQMNV